jgi:hypothetical protein
VRASLISEKFWAICHSLLVIGVDDSVTEQYAPGDLLGSAATRS